MQRTGRGHHVWLATVRNLCCWVVATRVEVAVVVAAAIAGVAVDIAEAVQATGVAVLAAIAVVAAATAEPSAAVRVTAAIVVAAVETMIQPCRRAGFAIPDWCFLAAGKDTVRSVSCPSLPDGETAPVLFRAIARGSYHLSAVRNAAYTVPRNHDRFRYPAGGLNVTS